MVFVFVGCIIKTENHRRALNVQYYLSFTSPYRLSTIWAQTQKSDSQTTVL